jgi:hypothetical protein
LPKSIQQSRDHHAQASFTPRGVVPLTKSITAPTATNLNSISVYTEGDASVPITDIVINRTNPESYGFDQNADECMLD